ncbi:MAG: CinA family protein [Halobacteriota archaeon]
MNETDESVEATLGSRLRESGETIAVAESLTGGLVSSLLTDVSGSSAYFDRSLVTYSNEAKQAELAVSRESLDEYGAVSDAVAREMAHGVRDVADTTWGVSTTGIAGPTGGTEAKPVGLVYIGVAYAGEWGTGESFTRATRYEFTGDRATIKDRSARQALRDVLDAIVDARSSVDDAGDF